MFLLELQKCFPDEHACIQHWRRELFIWDSQQSNKKRGIDLSSYSCDDPSSYFFLLGVEYFFFRCSVDCARGFAFPKNNPFSPVEYMHYSENYSIFFSQNRIPSEPSSPMLRLLAQTFERMISQKKRNRGIKRRRLLQNVTPLLTSSETHSSWSK